MTEQQVAQLKAIGRAKARLSERDDSIEETTLLYADPEIWFSALTPSVTSIALLGQLMLMQSDDDFSLESKRPEEGFKFLKQPSSYRACLVQAANQAFHAFSTADTNMEQIRELTSQIPSVADEVMHVLLQGSNEEREALAPLALEKIEKRATSCKELASKAEKEFRGVVYLIHEIMEFSEVIKQLQGDTMKEGRQEMQAMKAKKDLVLNEKTGAEGLEQLTTAIKQAADDFRAANEARPDDVSLVTSLMTQAIFNGIAAVFSVFLNEGMQLVDKVAHAGRQEDTAEAVDEGILVHVAGASEAVSTIFADLNRLVKEKDGTIRLQEFQKADQGPIFYSKQMNSYLERMKDKQDALSQQYCKLLDDGSQLCENLASMLPGDMDAKSTEHIQTEVQRLCDEADALFYVINSAAQTNPSMSQMPNVDDEKCKATAEVIGPVLLERAGYHTEAAKSQLHWRGEQFTEACERLSSHNDEMKKLVANMGDHSIKQCDFKCLQMILTEGKKALSTVHTQWAKLVLFFQSMSNVVNSRLYQMITEDKGGHDMSALIQEVLFAQANTGVQAAHRAETLASLYSQVSTEHLMPNVVKLGKLIALDPGKQRENIRDGQNGLNEQCGASLGQIHVAIDEKVREFKSRFDERILQIETTMRPALPAMTTEEKNKAERVKQSAASYKAIMGLEKNLS